MVQYSNIPESWLSLQVSDIGSVVTGNTPPTNDSNNYGSFLPFIKPPELVDRPITSSRYSLSEQGTKSARILTPYSVLVSCIGNLGKTGLNKNRVAFNQQINAIVPDECILPAFLFYQTQSHSFRSQLESKASATTISIVNKGNFETIELVLPPLNEQHRLVAKIEELFSELDKGVENLKTAREQLKVYRQALLKHAFEGKLTAKWREENKDNLETAAQLMKRIKIEREQRYKDQLAEWEKNGSQGRKPAKPKELPPLSADELSGLPELPEGWAWVKSGDLFESVTSGSRGWAEYYSDSGAIFLRITNMDFDTLQLDLSPKKIQYVKPPAGAEGLRTKVKEGDFFFSITGYLGMFAIAPSLQEAYVNQHIALVRPIDGFSKEYFGYYATSHTGGIRHLGKQTKGAVKAGLGLDDIQNFPVPMCSFNEQLQISSELESRLSVVEQLEKTVEENLQKSEALRQSILKKAFSGQLVPQDPHDEPASVLLARIKAEKAVKAPVAKNATTHRKPRKLVGQS